MKIYVDAVTSTQTQPLLRQLIFSDVNHKKYIVENFIIHKGLDVPYQGKVLYSQKFVGIFNIKDSQDTKITEEEFIEKIKKGTLSLTKAVYDTDTKIKGLVVENNGESYKPLILNKILYKEV